MIVLFSGSPAGKIVQDFAHPIRSPAAALADLYAWLASHWFNIVIAFGVGICLYFMLSLLRGIGPRLYRRSAAGGFGLVLGRAVARTSHLFMMLVAARLVVGYANPPEWLHDTIRLLFTIVSVFQVAIWVREIVIGLIERQSDPQNGHETISNAMGIIRLLVTVALFAIAAVVVLDNVGVNVTGLVAGLGIGGIAIGLAAQGIFSDLFAALSIIFDKPFRTGDAISYDKTSGRVERIGLKSTRLRAVTGERKIISNTQLLGKEITNLADLDHRRLKFTIAVPRETPADLAMRIADILREAVEAEKASFIRSGFTNFGASSLDYEVEFDVFSPDWDTIYATRHRIGLGILRRFDEQQIELAPPVPAPPPPRPAGRSDAPKAARN